MFLKKFFYVQKPRYLSIFNRETNILFKQGLFTQCYKLSFIPNNIVSIYNFFIQMILWIQETMSLMEKTLTLPMKRPLTPMTSLRIPAVTSLRTMIVTMIKTKSGWMMICVSMKMLTILVIFLIFFTFSIIFEQYYYFLKLEMQAFTAKSSREKVQKTQKDCYVILESVLITSILYYM